MVEQDPRRRWRSTTGGDRRRAPGPPRPREACVDPAVESDDERGRLELGTVVQLVERRGLSVAHDLAARRGRRRGGALDLLPEEVEGLSAGAHGSGDVAGVHAFDDARQLPVPERDVEVDVRQVATRGLRRSARATRPSSGSPRREVGDVAGRPSSVVRDRSSRPAAGRRRRAGRRACRSPSRAPPRSCRRRRACSCRAGSRRARSWPALLRRMCASRCSCTSSTRDLAGLRLLPLRVPPLQLPLDVALFAAEIAEADRVDVDVVDASRGRRRGLPRASALLGVERVAHGARVTEDVPVDEFHHVERCAVHVDVVAEAERGSDGHVGWSERRDDAVLATHVVRGRQHMAERRPSEHPARSLRIGDAKGEVRVAAGDQFVGERWLGTLDVVDEPPADALGVDALWSVDVHADTVVRGLTEAALPRTWPAGRRTSRSGAARCSR